jgi:hypothetical protein
MQMTPQMTGQNQAQLQQVSIVTCPRVANTRS